MRWMARPGQHDREVQLFVGLGVRAWDLAKHRSHLEEAHVPLTLAPVELDPADQAWEQAAAQMGLFCRERIQDGYGIGTVGGAEGERAGLEETGPARDELGANAPQRELGGRGGDGAWAVGPQLG